MDGSAGVEAQTMTVWRQAQRYNVPCIAFINKLDKPNADLNMTLDSMEKKLGLKPILTQVPLENGQLMDLINLEILTFDSKGNGEMNTIGLDKTVCLGWVIFGFIPR